MSRSKVTFLLGYIFGLLLTILNSAVLWSSPLSSAAHRAAFFYNYTLAGGEYFLHPLSNRCSTKPFRDEDGNVGNPADFFGCDKFQRFINVGDDK